MKQDDVQFDEVMPEYGEALGNYDPLLDEEEWDEDERAETFGYVGDPGELAPHAEIEVVVRTPREKIDELFENMLPVKRYFLAIIDYCREVRSLEDMEAFIDALQEKRKSIYTPASFCRMLVEAEALQKINEDGEAYVDELVEPVEIEDEFGNVCLVPGTPKPAFWVATEDGLALVSEDNPVQVILDLIDEKFSVYKPIFLEILQLCDIPGGSSINEIKDQVNPNPILQKPMKTAQFFMDYLMQNGLIVWDQKWQTTSAGKQLLGILDAD